ncbi:hypothetical protein ACTHGU_07420 [Chitinophagaceae bacterium MMS25-I14]
MPHRTLIFISLLLAIVASSCEYKPAIEYKLHKEHFTVEEQTIEDTNTISQSLYREGKIICHMGGKRTIVFDTAFKYLDSYSRQLCRAKVLWLCPGPDTAALVTWFGMRYFDTGLHLKKLRDDYASNAFMHWCYSDSVYNVYCCNGSGCTYFVNKHSRKCYACQCSALSQVLLYNGQYVLCCQSGGDSFFTTIKDPTALFPVMGGMVQDSCTGGIPPDSMMSYFNSGRLKRSGAREYAASGMRTIIATFQYKNELYSIYTTYSQYTSRRYVLLGLHQNYSLIPVDTLLRHGINAHYCHTSSNSNVTVATYFTEGMYGDGDRWKEFGGSGIVVVNGNHIRFLNVKVHGKESIW